ncbi:hypothetical protein [Staphylococcus hominis]|uniref:hypothetical protein n=1 Tax=Staphylococcus hominis TaxID=1290 RepID=UPI00119CCBC2|nr:hypothetical protein [Staphylococcus hominis]
MAEVNLSQESYDELLKDIKALRLQADTYFEQWQDAKKKAEAFDEMVKIYNQKNDLPSDEIYMEMGYCISDLERGSDER